MLVGFAPGILIAVLLYLDKTDPTKHIPHKESVNSVQTIRTATLAQTGKQTAKISKRNTIRKRKKSVEGDTDKIKYTFYLKLLDDETIVGDRQIRREARKYRQQLRREQHAERTRLKKIKQRKIRLAKKKKQQAAAAKKSQRKSNKKRNLKIAAAKKSNRKKKIKSNKRKRKTNSKRLVNQKTKQRKKKLNANKKKKIHFPDYILIQAGSFRKKKQADQHRAKLALYGVNAVISSATIKGEMWYRVRVGPFRSYKDMKSKLTKLRKKRIKVMPIRVGHR